ncbi:hypothetical protein AAFC00_004067 [Neodothiora populina]|uniref:DUF1772-domain-containing protein n=1 Tax=Neodothiora populina TaxID=2781224 RepID=A0ABR3PIF5_9PEZI
MPCPITVLKFVGTTSLGLFTGVSYSLSTLSMPALLLLPSAPQAQHAFTSLVKSSTLHLRTLAAVSAVSFPLAFAMSTPRIRHPYLLWTGAAALLSLVPDFVIGQTAFKEQQDANGETVERAVRTSQKLHAVQAAIGFAGFAMAVVGIWGDGA